MPEKPPIIFGGDYLKSDPENPNFLRCEVNGIITMASRIKSVKEINEASQEMDIEEHYMDQETWEELKKSVWKMNSTSDVQKN